jgi:hypothetical protein
MTTDRGRRVRGTCVMLALALASLVSCQPTPSPPRYSFPGARGGTERGMPKCDAPNEAAPLDGGAAMPK